MSQFLPFFFRNSFIFFMVAALSFGVAAFEADCPGVFMPPTLPPAFLTDYFPLFPPFMMVFEATFLPGVFLVFLAETLLVTLTPPGPPELEPLSLSRKPWPFSALAMLFKSTVAVVPFLNPYWNLLSLPRLTTELPFVDTSGKVSFELTLSRSYLWW